MKISNFRALTTTEVCSALNNVRAMKLHGACMDSYLNFVTRIW